MKQSEYLLLILDGITNHWKYLAEHFYRTLKEAEKKHINAPEYFDNLKTAAKGIEAELKRLFSISQERHFSIINSFEEKGKDLTELKKQEPVFDHININLLTWTRGGFEGRLYPNKLNHINSEIKRAREMYEKNQPSPLKHYNSITEWLETDSNLKLFKSIYKGINNNNLISLLNFEFSNWAKDNKPLNEETFKVFFQFQYDKVQNQRNEVQRNSIETENKIQSWKSEAPQQTKTYPSKFYSLYHWLKIEMGEEMQFAKNDNDQFIKTEIEAYAKNKYPNCSTQGFYRSFKELDITNRTAIAKSFGSGYKQKLIAISNNDNILITHLKKYPN